jgi:hypothetical protein
LATGPNARKSSFALGESIDGIGRQPAGVADLWINRGTRRAKAEGEITVLIHRRAAHPSRGRVRLVSALLKQRWRGCHRAQLKPANTGDAAGTDRKIAHDGFVAIAELPIGGSEHQAIADPVQLVGRSSLGHTGAGSWTKLGKAGGDWSAKKIKGGVSGRNKIGVE